MLDGCKVAVSVAIGVLISGVAESMGCGTTDGIGVAIEPAQALKKMQRKMQADFFIFDRRDYPR